MLYKKNSYRIILQDTIDSHQYPQLSHLFFWKDFQVGFVDVAEIKMLKKEHYFFIGECFSSEQPTFSSEQILNQIFNPEDQNIAKQIANKLDTKDFIFEQISLLSGSFLLIFSVDDEFIILNDCSGQCETYFDTENICLASEPNLLPSYNTIENTKIIKPYLSYTEINTVRKISPNHYYSVNKSLLENKLTRFYPTKKTVDIGLKETEKEAILILQGTILAMANRKRLAIGITAGWDSRVLLAASRMVLDRVDLFLIDHENGGRMQKDIAVAKDIAAALSLPIKIIKRESLPAEIQNLVEVEFQDFHTIGLTLQKHFPNHYIINGNVSEVAKNFYQPLPYPMSASDLMYIMKREASEGQTIAYNQWLHAAKPLLRLNFDILDLLYWEDKMSNWLAVHKSIFNQYTDVISPFNNRYLLNLMLGLNAKYRDKLKHQLYKNMVETMMPELRNFAINPDKRTHKIRLMKVLGIYKWYRKIYFKQRKLKF